MPNILCLLSLLAVAHWPIPALAFNFTSTTPTQCDDFNISWFGGSAPFSLLITPLHYGVPINISLPNASFNTNANTGAYSLQLPIPAKQQLLLSMSDSTGFASGGISGVLTVGSSISGADCNTTSATPPYTFELNSALQQCEDFTFSGFNGSVPPVTIFGLIPVGQFFELETSAAPGTDEFDWIVSVPVDTAIAFLMVDSEGRSGGSSGIRFVDETGDSSCLNASSPHSTAGVFTDSQGVEVNQDQSSVVKSGSNTGAIIGAVLGVLVLLGFSILGILLCLRRRQRKKPVFEDKFQAYPEVVGKGGMSLMSRASSPQIEQAPASFDLLYPSSRSLPHMSPQPNSAPFDDNALPKPHISPSVNEASIDRSTQYSQPAPSYHTQSLHSSYSGQSMSPPPYDARSRRTTARSTGQLSPIGTVRSDNTSDDSTGHSIPRFIIRTDAEVPNPESDDDIVELLPQYIGR